MGFHCDVLVVGLGPVGAVAAALLAAEGVSVIAIDKEPNPYPLPRAVHFDHEIMRVFQQLGVADEVRRHAKELPPYEFRNGDGELLFRVEAKREAACGWSSGYMFHQPSLERGLRDLLATLPGVDVRLGTCLECLDQTEEEVVARLKSPTGPTQLRARYLLGCDGASSVVRTRVGVGLSDYGFDEPWLVVDAKVGANSKLPAENLQYCDPARPTTCVHSGLGRHRWEFMLLPGETAEEALEVGFAEALLARHDVGRLGVERRAVYRFHGLVADRFRVGRVLIAGDAAHQMPPFAGQGMCSGIRDAANVAWKLAAVVRGADDGLLDSYQREREPHVRSLIQLAIDMGRLVCMLDPDAAAARDRQFREQNAGGVAVVPAPEPTHLLDGCVLAGTPGAGTLFPQPTRGLGTRRLRLDDALGDGAWLLSRAPAADSHAVGVACHLDDPLLAPFRDSLAQWLDEHEAQAVLVRPDRYVYGTGAAQDLTDAWRRVLRGAGDRIFEQARRVEHWVTIV